MAESSSSWLLVAFCLASACLTIRVHGKEQYEGAVSELLSSAIPEHHQRFLRSVEGAPCTTTGGQPLIYHDANGNPVTSAPAVAPAIADSCLLNALPNTRCNTVTGKCECDPNVSARLNLFPNAAICLPLSYVNNTNGGCLPSLPDMCTVQVSGSYCANTAGNLKCLCKAGGTWPNCVAQLGVQAPCQNTTSCRNQIPNSYCGNVVSGYGTCQCPIQGTPIILQNSAGAAQPAVPQPQTVIPNLVGNQCVPQYCPTVSSASGTPAFVGLQPCNGDSHITSTLPSAQPFTCTNTSTGYSCTCNQGSMGRAHSATVTGRCCAPGDFVCADFSKCILSTQVCDGVVDCPDCSDENDPRLMCTGAWPANPACGLPNRGAGK